MVELGKYNTLKIARKVDFGVYLDDGESGILLPNRYLPKDARIGDELEVFIHHDGEGRVIATTEKPKGIIGDILMLKCISTSDAGSFLDWGLPKDLYVAKAMQLGQMKEDRYYLVKIYLDEQTDRIAAAEKMEFILSNHELSVKEMEVVDLIAYRKTDLGFLMIVNKEHLGLLHNNQIFQKISTGDKLKGFVKAIRTDNKMDIVVGLPGYQKVEDETSKIIRLLKENKNYLPFDDKSEPEAIYKFFGMSKKVFKMTIGALYKQRKIDFAKTGIKLIIE